MNIEIYKNKVKFRYEKFEKNLFELAAPGDIRKWMRRYFPKATTEEHLALRDQALKEISELSQTSVKERDTEFIRRFGRPYNVSDYLSDDPSKEFSPELKRRMKELMMQIGPLHDIALAHNQMLPLNLKKRF